MNLVNKNITRGPKTKSISWGTRIKFPTKIPKGEAILLRDLGVLLVKSNIWVGVLPERMVVFLVVEKATK